MSLFRRKRKQGSPVIALGATDEAPSRSFGYKSAWLAVRAADCSEVADALGLDQTAARTWAVGIAEVQTAAVGTRPAPVFVGSPIDGWVLVLLSSPSAGADEFDLGALSQSGELTFSEGEPTELEEDLLPDADADWEDWEIADEERVIELAAAWSIDPTRLDERADVDDSGLIGRR